MATLLDTLLEPGRLSVLFQPIFEIQEGSRRLHAFESLTRGPKGTNMENPSVMFEYARRKGKEMVLDRVCVSNALRVWAPLEDLCGLNLNVHASTLERDSTFPSFLKGIAEARGIHLSQLTIEIVEHAPSWDGPRFHQALQDLRTSGIQIALDDVGLGHSNFRMILEAAPDYFKADRYLVDNCHRDPRRLAVLESLVNLARRLGSRVVAEGIETKEDLDAIASLGIDLAQGFFLSRPLAVGATRDRSLLGGPVP